TAQRSVGTVQPIAALVEHMQRRGSGMEPNPIALPDARCFTRGDKQNPPLNPQLDDPTATGGQNPTHFCRMPEVACGHQDFAADKVQRLRANADRTKLASITEPRAQPALHRKIKRMACTDLKYVDRRA